MYNIDLEITYTNYSTGTSTSINKFVSFDPAKISPEINNNNGRNENLCSGTLEISGADYIYLFDWDQDLNFFDSANYSLYENGLLVIDSSYNIQLSFNDKDFNKAYFAINGNVNDKYDTIYKSYEDVKNIYTVGTVGTVKYTNFKSEVTQTKNTVNTFSVIQYGENANNYIIDYQAYIDNQQALYPDWKLKSVTFTAPVPTCIGAGTDTLQLNCAFLYYQQTALGINTPPNSVPPAGVKWVYKDNQTVGVIDYSRYMKPHISLGETLGTIQIGGLCGAARQIVYYSTITYDLPYNATISYLNIGRPVEDVIEYLVGEIDSSIQFDSNSFYSFDNYTGLTATSMGNLSFDSLLLCGVPDIIPQDNEFQKANPQEKLEISLKTILDWFEQRGFYWYIELISSVYYFRIRLVADKSLLTGNPDLSNYYGNNWLYLGNDYNSDLNLVGRLINNTTSGHLSFSADYFDVAPSLQGNTKGIDDINIYTDVDHIIDAKTEIFSDSDTTKFVMLATTLYLGSYNIRATDGVLTELTTNNNELSFNYLCTETVADLAIPINTTTDLGRLKKRKVKELKIPIETFYTDFDFFKYLLVNGEETEIDNIKKTLADNFATIKYKR